MQQHFLNEMEISQPTRMPRPFRVWLTPGGSWICCPGVGGDVRRCLILSFSDRFRQLPPAPTWHVLGRARNSSEVLISGLKEGPHDCDHAAPLLLCDGARGFGHALIKGLNNSRGSVSLSPGAVDSPAPPPAPKIWQVQCQELAGAMESQRDPHGMSPSRPSSLQSHPQVDTCREPSTKGCPKAPPEPAGNAKPRDKRENSIFSKLPKQG